MKILKKSVLFGVVAAAISATAHAGLVNDGFKTGNLTGWTANLNGGSATAVTSNTTTYSPVATYTPVEGNYFLAIASGAANVWQTVSQTVSLSVGDTLSGWVAFDWGDYPSFYDGVSIAIYDNLNNAFSIYYDDGVGKPSGYNGPWDTWSYTADTTGTYRLEYAVRNTLDGGGPNQTYGYFDANIAAVPEPASLALVGLALAGLGASRRKRSA